MGPKDTVENELNLGERSFKWLLGWFPPAWRCMRRVVSLFALGWSPGEHTKDTSSTILPDYGMVFISEFRDVRRGWQGALIILICGVQFSPSWWQWFVAHFTVEKSFLTLRGEEIHPIHLGLPRESTERVPAMKYQKNEGCPVSGAGRAWGRVAAGALLTFPADGAHFFYTIEDLSFSFFSP